MDVEIKDQVRLPAPELGLQRIVVDDGMDKPVTIHLDFIIKNAQLNERKRMIQMIQDIVYGGSFEIVPYTPKGGQSG